MIWFKSYTLEDVRKRALNTMIDHVGIELIELGPDFFSGKMPVDARTCQPDRILHGGASVVLAETLASMAANMVVDPSIEYCVGLEINANHVRSCNSGFVIGKSTPVHLGRKTQVWETKISQQDKLISISRMTLAVLARDLRK